MNQKKNGTGSHAEKTHTKGHEGQRRSQRYFKGCPQLIVALKVERGHVVRRLPLTLICRLLPQSGSDGLAVGHFERGSAEKVPGGRTCLIGGVDPYAEQKLELSLTRPKPS